MVLEISLSFIVFIQFIVIVFLVRSFKISLENQTKEFNIFAGEVTRLIEETAVYIEKFENDSPEMYSRFCTYIKRYNTIVDRFNRKG
jgi:hypothetical protein